MVCIFVENATVYEAESEEGKKKYDKGSQVLLTLIWSGQ
jgi:hypothetical protein